MIAGTFNSDEFARSLLAMAGRDIVSAGVSSAISGTRFDEALKQNLINDLAAVGANAVGAWPALTPANVIGHATVGCAAASAVGNDCAAGAVGAVMAALVNPLIDPLTSDTSEMLRTVEHMVASMMSAGLLADALGLNTNTAAGAALNETMNNYLSGKGVGDAEAAIKRMCAGAADPTGCQLIVAAAFNTPAVHKADQCWAQGTCSAVAQEILNGANAIDALRAVGTLSNEAANILLLKQFDDLNAVLAAGQQAKPDNETVHNLVAAGFGTLAIGACAVNLSVCGAVLHYAALRAVTNPAAPELAEAVLLTVAGVAAPGSLSGVTAAASQTARTAEILLEAITEGAPAVSTVKGFLNATKVCASGCSLTGLASTEQTLVQRIAAWGDDTGALTEQLFTMIAERTGATVLAGGKYGPDNGFDLVLQSASGEVTILIDAKQLTSGAFSLSSQAAGNTTQLSEAWVRRVIAALPERSPAKLAVFDALEHGTLLTAVGGVNKATGSVVVVPVTVQAKSLVSQISQ